MMGGIREDRETLRGNARHARSMADLHPNPRMRRYWEDRADHYESVLLAQAKANFVRKLADATSKQGHQP